MVNQTLTANSVMENLFGVIIKACFEAAAEYSEKHPEEEQSKK